jgi:glycogen operon protein
MRDFWRLESGGIREVATRLSGSSDLYADDGRSPYASVNFITAHDGFTLRDLVSYNHKHNEANGEGNADGTDNNRSWNCGVEGETDDPDVLALRHRQAANLMATLCLSNGVPMITAGDERGRTQRGNNNAYCQDNEVSWVDWKAVDEELLAFVTRLVRLRRGSPALRQEAFFEGHEVPGTGGTRDLAWFRPGGGQLTTADWFDTGLQTVGMYLDGRAIRHRDERGRPVVDDSYLVWLHAGPEPVRVQLPGPPWGDGYQLVLSTEYATGAPPRRAFMAPTAVEIPPRTVWLLRVLRRP